MELILVKSSNIHKRTDGNDGQSAAVGRAQIVLWIIWLICAILKEANIAAIYSALTSCCYVAVFFMFVCELTGNYRYNKFEVLVLFILIPILWLQGLYLGNTGFAQLFSFIFLFRKTKKAKLFKASFFVMLFTVLVVAGLSLIGTIPDAYVQEISGNHARQARGSFGFRWPSRIQTYLLIMLCLYMIYKGEQVRIISIIVLCLIAVFVESTTDAMFPLCLMLAVAAVCLVLKLRPTFSFSRRKVIGTLFVLSFLIAAAISVALPMFYYVNPVDMESLNQLLTGRLYLSSIAINSRDLALFGTVLSANQGTTAGELLSYGYFDCGYLNFLYTYGFVPSIFFAICLTKAASRIVRRNERFAALALLAIAVLSMFYSHALMNPSYGIVLFLAGNIFNHSNKVVDMETKEAYCAFDRTGVIYG